MNVVVQSREIVSELAFLERIVSKKPTLPILSNVLLQAQDGWLHMSATDLELGMVTACQATVEMAGAITLPAKKLMDLAKSLADQNLQITADKGVVKLVGGTFNSRLQTLPAHDFPVLARVEGDGIMLPRQALRELLTKTRYAIDEGDTRKVIRGALLTLPENDFAMVTTDGKRLALAGATREGPKQESIIFPSKTLDQLIALLNDSATGKDITFTRTDRHLFFEIDGRVLISRQIDGTFPNYERIIPKGSKHVVTVDRLLLQKVIERAILISEGITLAVESAAIDVISNSVEVGEGSERVPAVYEGDSVEIKVKGEYVLDFLKAANGTSVQMSLKDSKSPALFSDGKSFVNVIMGMRV